MLFFFLKEISDKNYPDPGKLWFKLSFSGVREQEAVQCLACGLGGLGGGPQVTPAVWFWVKPCRAQHRWLEVSGPQALWLELHSPGAPRENVPGRGSWSLEAQANLSYGLLNILHSLLSPKIIPSWRMYFDTFISEFAKFFALMMRGVQNLSSFWEEWSMWRDTVSSAESIFQPCYVWAAPLWMEK